jgi:hypothetical protein
MEGDSQPTQIRFSFVLVTGNSKRRTVSKLSTFVMIKIRFDWFRIESHLY